VASANTPGYTEETPNCRRILRSKSTASSTFGGYSDGRHVVAGSVLEERLNQQQQMASASGARLAALNSIQALFPPDSGSASATAGDIAATLPGFQLIFFS